MVVIRRTWIQPRIKTRKACKGQSAAPATFGPMISPTTAITAGPIVVSSGALTVTHNQPVAAMVWVIDHGLGFWPDVVVYDTLGNEVSGVATSPTVNRTTLTFSVPVAGMARLS